MGAIFLFHSSAAFSYFPWDIMNSTPSLGLTIFGLFILSWVMPLFFVVSGISAYFSLARRSASQFTKERVQRLILPFVVGLLIILPVDAYYHAVSRGDFAGGFVQFISGPYFTKFFPFSLNLSSTFSLALSKGYTYGISSGSSYSPSLPSNSSNGSPKKKTATSSRKCMPSVTGAEVFSCWRFLLSS
jgi:hypothetical protein